MHIGVPEEIRDHEYRVTIDRSGVHELVVRARDTALATEAAVNPSAADEKPALKAHQIDQLRFVGVVA